MTRLAFVAAAALALAFPAAAAQAGPVTVDLAGLRAGATLYVPVQTREHSWDRTGLPSSRHAPHAVSLNARPRRLFPPLRLCLVIWHDINGTTFEMAFGAAGRRLRWPAIGCAASRPRCGHAHWSRPTSLRLRWRSATAAERQSDQPKDGPRPWPEVPAQAGPSTPVPNVADFALPFEVRVHGPPRRMTLARLSGVFHREYPVRIPFCTVRA